MINKDIHFLLVPDSNSRRIVQKELVKKGSCIGVLVGTWSELIHHLAKDYMFTAAVEKWDDHLCNAVSKMSAAFWATSCLVDSVGTVEIIRGNVKEIMATNLFKNDEVQEAPKNLGKRAEKLLFDLNAVIEQLNGELPEDLALVREVVQGKTEPVRNTRVYIEENYTPVAGWQKYFIDTLNKRVGSAPVESYNNLLQQVCDYAGAKDSIALGHIQRHLYSQATSISSDHSMNYYGVRDYLQEVEIAAGIIQKKVKEDSSLSYADFSIVVPNADEYFHALTSVFKRFGIPISGSHQITYYRDVARELVLSFLECQNKPAPVMVMAEFLTSSILPWDVKTGINLAQELMDGNYELKLSSEESPSTKQALSLMTEHHDTPAKLVKALDALLKIVSESSASTYQIERVADVVKTLVETLAYSKALNVPALCSLVKPEQIRDESITDFYNEGVTIFTESQEPWRHGKHLLILGFNKGHYPSQASFSPVFSDDDINKLRLNDLILTSRQDKSKKYLDRFLRQLKSCSSSCTFLIPRLKADSAKLHPSESLVYMHGLFEGYEEPSSLICDLDKIEDLDAAKEVPKLGLLPNVKSWEPIRTNIQLKTDLLSHSKNNELRPLSPSRLEGLMVSPLAWLLSWIGLEPKSWGVDEPNVLLLGSIAHGVFEDLFQPGKELVTPAKIKSTIEGLLDEQLHKIAPFMLSGKWEIERAKLMQDVTSSALVWRNMLEALDAKIVDNEIWLKGEYSGVPIHGQADSVLQLSDGRLIVVDHKKAGVKNRKPRMEKGYDCQVALYREMLKSGLPAPHQHLSVDNVEVLYYLMNGQRAISERGLADMQSIPGWISIKNDASVNAMKLIEERIRQVRSGDIQLNKKSDEDFYTKEAGFKPYALFLSPLIPLFMQETEGGEQ